MHIYVAAEQRRLDDGSGATDNLRRDVIGVSADETGNSVVEFDTVPAGVGKTTSCFACSLAALTLPAINPSEVSMSKKRLIIFVTWLHLRQSNKKKNTPLKFILQSKNSSCQLQMQQYTKE